MGETPSNLMKNPNFWLTAKAVSPGLVLRLQALVVGAGLRRRRLQSSGVKLKRTGPILLIWDAAVVKVPPPVGCVKYKAQHVVLAVRIPLFMRCS
jgi:hypothetical protein